MMQVVPKNGAPSSEKTEIWVMYDGENIYVSAKCWDTAPPEKWIANELRRDTNQMRQQRSLWRRLRHLQRPAQRVHVLRQSARRFSDYSVVDEGAPNTDWNPVWDVRTGRFDGGWTLEMQFPFKSLRYTSGADQTWGIQFRRSMRRKNEWDYWTPLPQQFGGPMALNRVSLYGTLTGLDLPPASKNLEAKPYALGKSTTDRTRTPVVESDGDGEVGGDLKYGITANLTADLTVNTDFAQVEIDEQQVNLTRFNLFLPEKRDFFLEGRGLFDFARGGAGGGGFGRDGGGSSDTPYLFYSRRIGLNRNRVIPIDVGGRLTGKVGGYGLGVMNIEAGDESVSGTPATNFTVMRVKRDILRRSTIGAMFTNRSQSSVTDRRHQPGVWRRRRARRSTRTSASAPTTRAPRPRASTGDNESYQGKFDWQPDRYGFNAEVLKVGKAFNPEVGLPAPDRLHAVLRAGTLQSAADGRARWCASTPSRAASSTTRTAPAMSSRASRPARSTSSSTTATRSRSEANVNYDLLLMPFSPAAGVDHPGWRLSLQRRDA